ncbi:MAG TPA: hypothetical protein LFV91_05795 [Rickettsia endosymbiont of Bembidion nr. Transversale]|nr:hypothetical protein [Rickettsia endosymbiont of Bembidion nr. Transversale]
MDPVDKPRDDT